MIRLKPGFSNQIKTQEKGDAAGKKRGRGA